MSDLLASLRRGAPLVLLWLLLVGGDTARAALPVHHELGSGLSVDLDGAGGLLLSRDGLVLLEVELLLMGGPAAEPEDWSEHRLSVAAGARLLHPELARRVLEEGMVGGRRGPGPGADDDGDGQADEDPFDGFDDDGDGRIDEDHAAVGVVHHAFLSELEGAGLSGARLRGATFAWPYDHVSDVLFWNCQLEALEAMGGAPATRLTGAGELQMADERLRPHLSMGRPPEYRLRFPWMRVAEEDGGYLYVGLVRLDGRASELLPSSDGVIWSAGERLDWPLALLVAPTWDALLHHAGQALLTYEGDRSHALSSRDGMWRVPPLCGRCAALEAPPVRLELHTRGDEELLVGIELEEVNDHLPFSHEGLRLEGRPLAAHLVQWSDRRAQYALPLGGPTARTLLRSLSHGGPRVEIAWSCGRWSTPHSVEIDAEPGLVRTETAGGATPLPSHLNPALLESWPNPFQESITLRFRVPRTLGESFLFEDGPPAGVDLEAPAPFGAQPTIRVRVYNVGGQLIRVLEAGRGVRDELRLSWDGKDAQGRSVAAGAYYVNVEVEDYSVTRRVLRLKP